MIISCSCGVGSGSVDAGSEVVTTDSVDSSFGTKDVAVGDGFFGCGSRSCVFIPSRAARIRCTFVSCRNLPVSASSFSRKSNPA